MGIYDSNLSCWERNQRGLPADHAGEGILGEENVDIKNKDEEIAKLISEIQADVTPSTDEQPKKKAKSTKKNVE